MFDKILNILQQYEEKGSYYDRLKSIDHFFKKHDLYREMWPKQNDTPMSFIWAVSTDFPEIFGQQIGSMAQMEGIFNPKDEIIFVADQDRGQQVKNVSSILEPVVNTKTVIIGRPFPGDGPVINWDVGANFASHNRLFFIRDMALFFNPWELLCEARKVNINNVLVNFSSVLGSTLSRFCNRWLYLVHPRFAPNPFLFGFVLDKDNLVKINGFDPRLSRGYDHTGELDFLLRWVSYGFEYEISEYVGLFHPGMTANSQEELQEMQFQSSVNRRYFFDRYGEEFINNLKPPFRADSNLIEVNHAMTYDPLSEITLEEQPIKITAKDLYSFSKWPCEVMVKEVK